MDLINLIKKTFESNSSVTELSWLESSISQAENEKALQTAFVAVPRHISKSTITLEQEIKEQFIQAIDFPPQGWTLQQLARTFILLHFNPESEKTYVNALTTLFETAEINELSTLYSALPLLHYPKHWLPRAKEGVRSNMGSVFDAIAFNNPYPSLYFDDAAWNQLVLKTIFGGKNIHQIHGLKARSNRDLAYMISDLAHERWAADRAIPPNVWEIVSPFIDQRLISDIEKLFLSENKHEQYAATLTCMQTDFRSAKDLLFKHYSAYQQEKMEWTDL
ncbi:MAG TPA: EboA domain-containing protein [Bacteroidia bacterium]|jgi:hypothetical protein